MLVPMHYDAQFLINWQFYKKKIYCCFLPQTPFSQRTHRWPYGPCFLKLPISQKVSVVEHWDQLFWIPRIILHQKHPLQTGKKIFFNFFNTKMTFLLLLSQQPWQTHIYLNLGSPKRVLNKLGLFILFSRHHEIIKTLGVAQFLSAGAENHRSTPSMPMIMNLMQFPKFRRVQEEILGYIP